MLRLSKKSEYALIAVQYIVANKGRVVSAKEIAEQYDISFEFVSKALQALVRQKFIASQQGATGGYVMVKDPSQTSVAAVIEAVEGKQHIVECCDSDGNDTCSMHGRCTIKTPMAILQQRMNDVLSSMTIEQLAAPDTASMLGTEYSIGSSPFHAQHFYTIQTAVPIQIALKNIA
jgi:Rrf2 family transcriptional regulator, nitric oxide-sensitive transcriptional repressor